MSQNLVIKSLHILFLGVLLAFIFGYVLGYQPAKAQAACAETAAQSVLGANTEADAFNSYNQLYKKCLSQKREFLF